MGIGKRIKEARNSLDMTQEELAKLLGVTKGSIANYENDTSHPKEPIMYKLFNALNVDANYLFQDVVNVPRKKNDVTLSEYEFIKKYRELDDHGRYMVDMTLKEEHRRWKAEQERSAAPIIDYLPSSSEGARTIKYYQSASAGTGIFNFGNEIAEQIPIPNTPENRCVDYAIKVSGNSMSPDYIDGDIVLVSQQKEIRIGDAGVFIKNGEAFLKELGNNQLISRNKDYCNIPVTDSDNIVCMGKVISKLENWLTQADLENLKKINMHGPGKSAKASKAI